MAKPIQGPYTLGRKTKTQTAQFIDAVKHTEFARVFIRVEGDSEDHPYNQRLRATANLLAASYDLYELAQRVVCQQAHTSLQTEARRILKDIHGE